MNKAKMNSLVAAGRAAFRKAGKAGCTDDIWDAVDNGIWDRYGELWPELHAQDTAAGTMNNMLDLPEYQEAVEVLAREGIPTCYYPEADKWSV